MADRTIHNTYFLEYDSYEFRIKYICNSLDLMCRNPLAFTEDSLLETIKEKSPDMIYKCPENIVKDAIHKWLPDAQSKVRTIELLKDFF